MRDRYICDRKYFADRRICCETEKSTVAASDAGDDSCRAAADIITVSAQEGGETTAGRTISTLEELEQFREEVNKGEDFEGKIIQLTAEIDLSERYGAEKGIDGVYVSWTPIGKDYGNSFAGTFDGGGHEI